ncbi:GOLPH3/VPS74 family protein [Arthrobacter zhaoguopingii]|uniref:GOLPH3/VPS74 family protein n=1 Tax=Arthrobacter zhaoguopingii TaxID=2681491 RepID=UPI001FEE8C02|nr:GPP34 family phosphoprotein [Arthrobacter zhaoguopingii]
MMTSEFEYHNGLDGSPGAPSEPTLVEDVLLLLFQPSSGTIAGETTLFYVLGGAVIADLALAGRVEARESGRFSITLHALGEDPPNDEHLRSAWEYMAEKPRNAQSVLASIGPVLRAPILDRLVARGDLISRATKTFGIFNSTSLSVGSERRAALLDSVRATLLGGEDPNPRTAAAISLLSASGTLSHFHPEIPWSGDVYTRGKQIQMGNWGANAAGSAVTRTMTAITVNPLIAATVLRPD